MYISVLEQFLDNVNRVGSLEGNQGRRVTRVIEQYFQAGVMRLTVMLSSELPRLAYAAYLAGAAQAVSDANLEMQMSDNPAVFSLELSRLEERSITFAVAAQPPQSMRERQSFLRGIARGVEQLAVLLPAYARSEQQVLDGLYEDSPEDDTPEAREADIDGFNALVDGNMAFVNCLPMTLVHYAGLLNPAVAAEARGFEAQGSASAYQEPTALMQDA